MHKPLPVAGYTAQHDENVKTVNEHKVMEERILRRIEDLFGECCDSDAYRWLSIARTHIEQGFMAMNRAVFMPNRIKLPEDES